MLQKKGLVDAVLSEDVDTLAFGSGMTLRNWSPQPSTKTKTPSHVNLYDAAKTKAGSSGLDKEGMILIALMSGGDYVPEGIPGCGPKTACEAARAGFGADLCKIDRNDRQALERWKERLIHEMRTNESKFFRQKHRALTIPDEFPRSDILGYYTHPVVSTDERIEKLKQTIVWDHDFDIPALRSFCADAFAWTCISGAKHFARKLAHSLLVKKLRLRSDAERPDDLCDVAKEEANLVKSIYLRRQHPSTDGLSELRISFVPLDLVPIDLDAEEPDPEITNNNFDVDDEAADEEAEEPASPKKARGPMTYDPRVMQKAWIPEIFIKVGVPLKAEDWEESHRDARKYEAMKALRRREERTNSKKRKATGGMQAGAMKAFTHVTKSMSTLAPMETKETEAIDCVSLCDPVDNQKLPARATAAPIESVNLTGISKPTVAQQIGVTNSARPSSAWRSVAVETVDMTGGQALPSSAPERPESRPKTRTTFRPPPSLSDIPATPKKKQLSIVDLMTPSSRSSTASAAVVPSKRPLVRSLSDPAATLDTSAIAPALQTLNEAEETGELPVLPPSVNTRRRRSPLHRSKTIANVSGELSQGRGDDIMSSPPSKRPSLFKHAVADDPLPAVPSRSLRDCYDDKENPAGRPKTPDVTESRLATEPILISSSPEILKATSVPRRVSASIHDPGTPSPTRVRAAPDKAVTKSQAQRVKEIVRLRESLNGSFAVESVDHYHAQQSLNNELSPGRRRKGAARDGRTWRKSEVEVLDLTSGMNGF